MGGGEGFADNSQHRVENVKLYQALCSPKTVKIKKFSYQCSRVGYVQRTSLPKHDPKLNLTPSS
jgi:hypothetical protein